MSAIPYSKRYYQLNKERFKKNTERNYILSIINKPVHNLRIPIERINNVLKEVKEVPIKLGAPYKYFNDEDRKAARLQQVQQINNRLKVERRCNKEMERLSRIDLTIF